MKKDSQFWFFMVINIIASILLSLFKHYIDLLPKILMHSVIKIELIMQIGLGFYGLWISTHRDLFNLSVKIYGALFIIYVILKIPLLEHLNQYYIAVPAMFTPLPFVVAWLVDKSFYRNEENNNEIISN